jgi:hypothetical protein
MIEVCMSEGAVDEVNGALADKKRMDWLAKDRERFRYVSEYLEIVEYDNDLRGCVDHLMKMSDADLQAMFIRYQDRRMRR